MTDKIYNYAIFCILFLAILWLENRVSVLERGIDAAIARTLENEE
jgi:hypothetical protein